MYRLRLIIVLFLEVVPLQHLLLYDRWLFLIDYDFHYVDKFAVYERSMMCWLWHRVSFFILRKAEGEHWMPVSHFYPKKSYFGRIEWNFRDLAATSRNDVLRLKQKAIQINLVILRALHSCV